MMDIEQHQRCYHHRMREAVVRCPGCGRYYCRECVTEHAGRMLCSHCLSRSHPSDSYGDRRWLQTGWLVLQALGGWLIIGYAFYLLGRSLLAIPYDFHEGTLWKGQWW